MIHRTVQTLLRTEDQLITEAMSCLGLQKRGSRVVAALTEAIARAESRRRPLTNLVNHWDHNASSRPPGPAQLPYRSTTDGVPPVRRCSDSRGCRLGSGTVL